MKDNFSQVEGRVRRYWFTDGIGELMGGALFLLLGLYFSAQQYFGDQSPIGIILQSSFVILVIGGAFVGRWMINQLKARLTYPRTGYVEYSVKNKGNIRRRTIAFALAMGVAMFAIVITRSVNTIDSMVALTGLLVSVIYVLSAIALILGIVLSVSGFARGYNLGIFYSLMGVAFVVSGGLTLRHYLSENPLPAEDTNE
jgi:hypothetical protein